VRPAHHLNLLHSEPVGIFSRQRASRSRFRKGVQAEEDGERILDNLRVALASLGGVLPTDTADHLVIEHHSDLARGHHQSGYGAIQPCAKRSRHST
jgi:hypothetical protein